MMFSSGSVQLTQTATNILDKIMEVVGKYPDREIRIEGHTDNVGIALEFQDRFKSNWELSTARALSVLRFFVDKTDADPRKLSAVGYGEYRPLVPNDTPENKRLNRRVDIVILPK